MKRRWKKEEIEYLKKNYGAIDIKKVAKKLKKTTNNIRQKAHTLGITNPYKQKQVNLETVYSPIPEKRKFNLKVGKWYNIKDYKSTSYTKNGEIFRNIKLKFIEETKYFLRFEDKNGFVECFTKNTPQDQLIIKEVK